MRSTNQIVQFNNIAAFMTADSDFWVTSRFERLHLINLLFTQHCLTSLEEEINDHLLYDQSLIRGESYAEPKRDAEKILAELPNAIREYTEAISSLAVLKKSEAPAPHIVGALREGVPESSAFSKSLYFPYKLELSASRQLSVGAEPKNWMYRCVARHQFLARIFEKGHKVGQVAYTKFSEELLRKTEFGIVAIFLCLVQLLPVLALTLVSSQAVRLAIIIILIGLVSILNTLFANAVRATNFGAIAAYSAIVVVFISQDNQK
ncbi:hypothetical protein B0J11DRAFT_544554, partial [Dendryphion nanum]